MRDERVKFKKEHLQCSNLAHYAAIIDRVKQEGPENVDAVAKIFRYPPKTHNGGQKEVGAMLRAEVDIVCKKRACWIKVKAMTAEGISAVVNGTATGGHKSVLEIGKEVVNAARYNLLHYLPPVVLFYFSRGVSPKVERALQKMGVYVEGEIVKTPIADFEEEDSDDDNGSENGEQGNGNSSIYQNTSNANEDSSTEALKQPPIESVLEEIAQRDITLVNLDVTTLITMVSDITNGYETDEFDDDLLQQQAEDERNRPTLPDLRQFFEGKDVFTTQQAVEKFLNIVQIVGGPREQQRAKELIDPQNGLLRIVPDHPSPELLALKGPRIREQHRIIFGTAHALKATTVTANAAFAATAKQRGIFLSLHLHPARALTEQKAAQFKASKTQSSP